ncbi:hypothetical protein DFH07DRAFT_116800 [Mycena maculata]|uniref:Transcription activator of gluconeogenesis ERT1 n=1 Tax=Mycena maculata TaxID=230809 RepID=A0AAD7I689_9AGAR|nr:hypothetical protein DFH07DRAFT_116800 [Mycena maculata]
MGFTDGADGANNLPESPVNEFTTLSSAGTLHIQVKNACTNCQQSCKKCDEARPCLRCVKYGRGEECIDSARRERKKGAKRGPYKKRDGKGNIIASSGSPPQEDEPESSLPTVPPVPIPVGYTPGLCAQYPLPPGHKPGDVYYPLYYLAPVPQHAGQERESATQYPPQLFPASFMTPYSQPYPQYILHPGPGVQMAPHYSAPGSVTACVKPPEPQDSSET